MNPSTNRPQDRRAALSVAILIVLVAAVQLMTIDADHAWGDFAMYILHARNLATGVDYGQTGYIYNPGNAELGPPAYPPVFPALLAPVYYFFGLSLRPMKVEIVVFFALFLAFVYGAFKNELSKWSVLLLLAGIAFNPFFWNMRNSIASDIPFLALFYGSLLAIERLDARRSSAVTSGIALGILFYMCYGTRALGAVLLPALVTLDLLRNRKLSLRTLVAGVVFCAGFVGQAYLVPGVGGYVDQLRADPSVLLRNVGLLARDLSYLFLNGHSLALRLLVMAIVIALASIGLWLRARRELTVFELFPLFYVPIILAWPANQGLRFLMPLVPSLFFYALYAIERSSLFRSENVRAGVTLALSLILALSYVGEYSRALTETAAPGVYKAETQEMFSFVHDNVGVDDVVIFRKPRALALFTDRRSAVYHEAAEDAELWEYFGGIAATFVVSASWDDPYFKDFLERNRERFVEVYSNAGYSVLRISRPPGPPAEGQRGGRRPGSLPQRRARLDDAVP